MIYLFLALLPALILIGALIHRLGYESGFHDADDFWRKQISESQSKDPSCPS